MIFDTADFCYNKKMKCEAIRVSSGTKYLLPPTSTYIDIDRLGGYLDGEMVRRNEKGGF